MLLPCSSLSSQLNYREDGHDLPPFHLPPSDPPRARCLFGDGSPDTFFRPKSLLFLLLNLQLQPHLNLKSLLETRTIRL